MVLKIIQYQCKYCGFTYQQRASATSCESRCIRAAEETLRNLGEGAKHHHNFKFNWSENNSGFSVDVDEWWECTKCHKSLHKAEYLEYQHSLSILKSLEKSQAKLYKK